MISLAGIDLLLEDPEGEVRGFLDRFLAVEDFSFWGGSNGPWNERNVQAKHLARNSRPLPAVTWPAAPAPRINTLYWPVTGATRWACGLFLIDGTQMPAILGACGKGDIVSLELGHEAIDGQGDYRVSCQVALLQPKRLTYPESEDESLWLLPLVDRRYYWQKIPAPDLSKLTNSPKRSPATWLDLLKKLTDTLQCGDIELSVSPQYQQPDAVEFGRSYESAAHLVDALASSLGRRLVADPGGTYRLDTATYAHDIHLENTKQPAENEEEESGSGSGTGETVQVIGGGPGDEDYTAVPAKSVVVFPVYTANQLHRRGRLFSVEVDSTDFGYEETTTSYKPFFADTAQAICPDGDDEEPGADAGELHPRNEEDLKNLAKRIVRDHLNWHEDRWEATVAGVTDFKVAGCYDYFHFFVGHRYASAEARAFGSTSEDPGRNPPFAIFTRIATLPPHVGSTIQWHQFPRDGWGSDVYEPAALLRRFELSEEMTGEGKDRRGKATVLWWSESQADYATTEDGDNGIPAPFWVYDPFGVFAGGVESTGYCKYMPDADRWEVLGGGGTSELHFELKDPLEAYSGDIVEAYARVFNADTAAWETLCGASVWVKDCAGLGFSGGVGAVGWGVSRTINSEAHPSIIDVRDIQCPPDVTGSCD